MKQLMKIAMFASALSALNACGSSKEQKAESSEMAAASSMPSKIDFNLGRFLVEENAAKRIGIQVANEEREKKFNQRKLVKYSNDGLSIGGLNSILVNSNIIVKGDSKALSAQYYLDAHLMSLAKYRALEAKASANFENVAYDYEVRAGGNSLLKGKDAAEREWKFTRQIGAQVPVFIVPGLEFSFGASAVGELNGKIKPFIDFKQKTAEVELTPSSGVGGSIDAGIGILFARGSTTGKIQVMEGKMPIRAGIAVSNGGVKPTLKLEPLKINALAGNVDLIATLKIGNILPAPMRKLWEALTGEKGLEYKYPVMRWDGFEVVKTNGYDVLKTR